MEILLRQRLFGFLDVLDNMPSALLAHVLYPRPFASHERQNHHEISELVKTVVQPKANGSRVPVKNDFAVRRHQFSASLIQGVAQFKHYFPSS